MYEDEVGPICAALLTGGSYEGKVAAVVMESLAVKVEMADATGRGTMTSGGVAKWLRDCKEGVLSL